LSNGIYTHVDNILRLFNDTTVSVFSGLVGSKKTLSISFAGSGADAFDWIYDFTQARTSFYKKHRPLIDALKNYLTAEGERIEQVLVSGHSLGGAMVQQLIAELSDSGISGIGDKLHGYTFGSIGGESETTSVVSGNMMNFLHVFDIVNTLNTGIFSDSRGGSQVIINSSLSHNWITRPITQHFKDNYQTDVNFLVDAAANDTTPFGRTTLADALRKGDVWLGDSTFGTKLQLATGTEGNDIVNSLGDDRFVLSGAGNDTIFVDWSLFFQESRIIEGGSGTDTFVFTRPKFMTSVQTLSDGGIDFKYLGTSIGTLYGIERIDYLGSVDRLDGQTTTVQSAPSGTTHFIVSNAFDYADAGDGAMTVDGTTGNDTVFVGRGNKTINGNAGDDILIVKAAVDSTVSTLDDATLSILESIRIDGGTGKDLMVGAQGNETFVVDNIGDVVEDEGGTDLVESSVSFTLANGLEDLTLTGTEAIDGSGNESANRITGNTAANILLGGAGNDTLDGGAGSDTLAGGDGSDAYFVRDAGDVVSETDATASTGGTDTVLSTLAAYTLTANVENGRIHSTTAANLTGNTLNNVLYAGAGNNVLDGGSGIDTVSYAYGLAGTTGVTVSLAVSTAQATGGSGSDTLTSIENLIGSAYADKLTGNADANSLGGGAGSDTLDGGAGSDTLAGGDGSDAYFVRDAGDVVSETNATASTGGTDTVLSTLAAYTLTANVENGRIHSTTAANLTGNTLNNVLYAGAGNNALNGGSGTDTVSYVYGLAGTTGVTVSLAVGTAQATGGSGSDTLTSIENLIGSASADKLTGNADANSLGGGAGSDTLDGGAGSDTLAGGDGSDAYFVRDAGDVVSETNATASTGGTDTVLSTLAAYTLTANVENGRIHSTTAANLTGNTLNNVLYAGAGNNALNGGSGTDTVSYVYGLAGASGVTVSLAVSTAQATGGSGSDTLISIENLIGSASADKLTGNSGANNLAGGSGNDTLDGGTGSDTMAGGDGNDGYFVRDAGDVVSETNAVLASGGSDTVYSSLAAYTLTANVENGRILATVAANLTGNTLNNVLYAGAGNNVLDGSSGTDTVSYTYANAGVTVSLATELTQNTGGSESDTLVSIDNLTGSTYNDSLTGNTSANSLNGGSGNDLLSGGLGNDILSGGLGNDTLFVGLGSDIIRFDTLFNATSNRDTISDFNVTDDTIQLENAIFTSLATLGTLAAGSFRSGAGFTTAADANDYLIYNSTTGALYYDADGSGAGVTAVQFATLGGAPALSNLDFVVT
jgi:Ca2+-binding RTX toxin-like protein